MDILERILYEDNDILVCHKPAGMAVQTKRLREPDMETRLKSYRTAKGEPAYIGIIHRLDQPVEGVMVFAKNEAAAAALSRRLQQDGFGKYYYAVVCGIPKQKEAVQTDYLVRDGRTNSSAVVPANVKNAKKAVLHYEVVEERPSEQRALLRIHLETGRHHQIRVQLAHMGCPIAGDRKYNPKAGTEGTALCAYRLSFCHPATGKQLTYEITPEGEAFQNWKNNFKG